MKVEQISHDLNAEYESENVSTTFSLTFSRHDYMLNKILHFKFIVG
jgi:hypothetical protein